MAVKRVVDNKVKKATASDLETRIKELEDRVKVLEKLQGGK